MRNSILILFLLSVFFTSCDSNRVYEENFAVDDSGWKAEDVKKFEIDIEDTISALNLYVNLRTSTDYPYSNIYLFLYSEYPDGYSDKDTLEIILADPSGKWFGESSGSVVENRILISQGGRFATKGKYIFKLEHGMREEVLPEIIDVGMRVELMQ